MEELMKALVTYFSRTGNTKKVAQAIYDAVTIEKTIAPVDDAPPAAGYDVIFCGFPVHAHSVPGTISSFIKNLPEGKKLALFSTHGSLRHNAFAKTAIEHASSLAKKATVIGTFSCRGQVEEAVIEALLKKPENKAWCEEARGAQGHPDDADLADARDFAVKMTHKVK